MPEYNGLYRGSVYTITDPEKRGRIRVLVPQVLGRSPSGWAEPTLGTKAEANHRVKDKVWVLFEGGDINRPTYISRMEVTGSDIKDGTIVPANLSDDFDFGGAPTDGDPPDHSPTPTVHQVSEGIILRWDEVVNPDLVLYLIFMSTDPSCPVNVDTFYDHTTSLTQIINREIDPGSKLNYGTEYYFRIVAEDADGAASPSAVGHASPGKMDGVWLEDGTVGGATIEDFALAARKFNTLTHQIY